MSAGNDGAVILWDVNKAASHGNNGKATGKTAAGGRGTPKAVARCVLLLLLRPPPTPIPAANDSCTRSIREI